MTAREFLRRMSSSDPFLDAPGCGICGQQLSESKTGSRQLGDQFVDSDCYFEKASNVIEEHPIRSARIRRG